MWNMRIAEITRKKDCDKKKEKSVTLDVDSPTVEESFTSSESQETISKNVTTERDPMMLAKKVKSLDNSDSKLYFCINIY